MSSTSNCFAQNADPQLGISLCIPRVFNNIDGKRIKRHMIEARLGFVERVDVISHTRCGRNGEIETYKRAYVHFRAGSWNMRDSVARAALAALQAKETIRIEYDTPWFWQVSISRSKRPEEAPSPKERTVQIIIDNPPYKHPDRPYNEIDSQFPYGLPDARYNLNDPIVARAIAGNSCSSTASAYDRSLQCDEEMQTTD